jgi:NAD(P)-dependent dehydrogenase (short-subunit alcohol dehydrogenase family)
MRLRGKVALLTGAAAAIKGELMGFGGAAAHLFVREGAKVVLTDIRTTWASAPRHPSAPRAMTRVTCTST